MSDELHISLPEDQPSDSAGIPLAGAGVSAGVPFQVEEYARERLDLNRELVRNPASTFFARVSGASMSGAGIDDGDLLVVDKSVEPYDGCVAVCYLDGEFTLKKVEMHEGRVRLMPANERYKPIEVGPDNEFAVWGVVRYSIKKL
jgi:DNA polymerase V